ncbi:MAG: sulfotransferase family 2 domain-containing protein [Pararhodobacter sp.]|nr:sulfotransferase family 2 domain-containing protein [Pararhodobacter sp.]
MRFRKCDGEHNEALDLLVSAHASLHGLVSMGLRPKAQAGGGGDVAEAPQCGGDRRNPIDMAGPTSRGVLVKDISKNCNALWDKLAFAYHARLQHGIHNLMISDTYNFVFIHVPKTGGNSIQKVLLPFSDDHMALIGPHHDGVDRFEIRSPNLDIHKHSSLEDYRRRLDPERFSHFVKVTCVRNPWDRCASYFFSPHRGAVTWSPAAFETFIEEAIKPHRDYLALAGRDGDPFDNVDIVLRFEHLDEDFAGLCDRLGIGRHALPHINASKRNHYRSYYNDHAIDLVANKFAAEITRFGYSF